MTLDECNHKREDGTRLPYKVTCREWRDLRECLHVECLTCHEMYWIA